MIQGILDQLLTKYLLQLQQGEMVDVLDKHGLCKFTEKRVLMPLSALGSNLENFTKVSAFLFL